MAARSRAAIDPRLTALRRGVEVLGAALALPVPAAACEVLARCLFAHLQAPDELARHLEEALRELGGQERPLFAHVAPLPLRQGTVGELADQLHELFSPHRWSYADGEKLGELFEEVLHPGHRKQHGAFYTPRPIVDYLLEATLPAADRPLSRRFRLLDPSCGAGNFLSAALEALFNRTWHSYQGPEGRYLRLKQVMSHHLCGIDLDPWALRLAQWRLAFLQYRLVPELRAPLRANLLSQDALQAHDPHLEPGFDVIVGNPPYGAELSERDKAFFQRHYRLGQGRQDTTALFIERSVGLLREHGRLGLVVPHGLTRTGAYAACRRMLVTELQLRALLDLGAAFPGVNLETIAFVAERPSPPSSQALPWAPDDRATVRLDSYRDGEWISLGTQEHGFFRHRPTMPIYADSSRSSWITRLERVGTPLDQVATLRRGVGISAKDPILALRSEGVPVVRGRDLRRLGQDAVLRVDPRVPLRERYTKDVLDAPRIAYQNIASTVVASLVEPGYLPLDTVNVLFPKESWEPDYLLALLNSRLMEAYFRLVIANKGQLTLHLDTPTLGSLPVMIPDRASQAQIALLHQEARALMAGTGTWDLAIALEASFWSSPLELEKAAKAQQAAFERRRHQAGVLLEQLEARFAELYGVAEPELLAVEAPRTWRRPPREVARAAEMVIARGLCRLLETSDRPRELGELWHAWARPDAESWAGLWGGSIESELPELLGRYGVRMTGRRATLGPGLPSLVC